jgi:hypothetical protein
MYERKAMHVLIASLGTNDYGTTDVAIQCYVVGVYV